MSPDFIAGVFDDYEVQGLRQGVRERETRNGDVQVRFEATTEILTGMTQMVARRYVWVGSRVAAKYGAGYAICEEAIHEWFSVGGIDAVRRSLQAIANSLIETIELAEWMEPFASITLEEPPRDVIEEALKTQS